MGSRSNCSEEKSPMVPNPDPKQYWNNWKNDMSLFSATNQERPYEQLLHNWTNVSRQQYNPLSHDPWYTLSLPPAPRKGTYCFRFLVGIDNNVKQKIGGGGKAILWEIWKWLLERTPLPPCKSITGFLKFTRRSPLRGFHQKKELALRCATYVYLKLNSRLLIILACDRISLE